MKVSVGFPAHWMLISHTRKFIYLKTLKTGGTSVEIYFEPWCKDPDKQHGESHFRNAESSQWGIVGSRGNENDSVWYNHAPAAEIRERLGEAVWREYFKFCVVRNPFDKVVSFFWFSLLPVARDLLASADFSAVRVSFAEWIKLAPLPLDRSIYTIDGKTVLDDFIRYERLQTDLERICRRLDVSWEPERLGRYKSEYRVRKEHFSEYYNSEAAAVVERQFGWELEYFGYTGPFGPLPRAAVFAGDSRLDVSH